MGKGVFSIWLMAITYLPKGAAIQKIKKEGVSKVPQRTCETPSFVSFCIFISNLFVLVMPQG